MLLDKSILCAMMVAVNCCEQFVGRDKERIERNQCERELVLTGLAQQKLGKIQPVTQLSMTDRDSC
jgi:hypothetical protein